MMASINVEFECIRRQENLDELIISPCETLYTVIICLERNVSASLSYNRKEGKTKNESHDGIMAHCATAQTKVFFMRSGRRMAA